MPGVSKLRKARYSITALSRSLLKVVLLNGDHNPFVHDAYVKKRLSQPSIDLMLTTADVELSTVPWASDDVPLQLTFPQRPSLVRADTIKCVEITRNVEDCHDPTGDGQFQAAAWRAIGDVCHGNPPRHEMLLVIVNED